MIGLAKGQKHLAEYQAQSKIGPGKLHLLNTGIAFEGHKKGPGLELDYNEIIHVHADKKDIVIIQYIEGPNTWPFMMRVKDAQELVRKITRLKNESVQLAALV